MKTLKLYVWDGAFPDCTGGVAFALAHSVKEARSEILKCHLRGYKDADARRERTREVERELRHRPRVFRAAAGYIVRGGG